MGHPQISTPFHLDNKKTEHFIKNNITQKHSKSWNMRFYWLQGQFFWDSSDYIFANYFMKSHFFSFFMQRFWYVLEKFILQLIIL